jgi:hypothetical protein
MTRGVGFGNVNVEAIQVPGQTDPRPRRLGFAFGPSDLDESLIELNRRGLTSGERRPLVATRPDGSKRAVWTSVTSRQFSDSDSPADATIHIFISETAPPASTSTNVVRVCARSCSSVAEDRLAWST